MVEKVSRGQGFEGSRGQEFILRLFKPLVELADAEHHQENFKSVLQQYCQKNYNSTPNYLLLDEKGPDHNKCFEVGVSITHRHFQSAWGVTKKQAEQKAAFNALIELKVLKEPNCVTKHLAFMFLSLVYDFKYAKK